MSTETDLTRKFRDHIKRGNIVGKLIKITPGPWGNNGEPDMIGALEGLAVAIEAKKGHLEKAKGENNFMILLDRKLTPLQQEVLENWNQSYPFRSYVLVFVQYSGRTVYIMASFWKFFSQKHPANLVLSKAALMKGSVMEPPVIWL